jgi:hypothetical protein
METFSLKILTAFNFLQATVDLRFEKKIDKEFAKEN